VFLAYVILYHNGQYQRNVSLGLRNI
jgi:hypothetical protein